MDKFNNTLRQIIVERIEMVQKLVVVEREIDIEANFPYVLVGIRRSGKSYTLYQIMRRLINRGHGWDEFLYINFEDERLIGFDGKNLNDILETFYSLSNKEPILFLDEIQNVQGWEKFARRLADEKRLVYITGSNAVLLSREMEAALGGRFLSKHIYPYSFTEFLKAKNHQWGKNSIYSTKDQGQLISLFDEYLIRGGFPEVVNLVNKRDYLSSVYNKIFLGDVIARNKISNTKALEVLMMKISESVRQPISYSRLTNIIQALGVSVSKTTIIQYIEYLKDSFLIFTLSNYSSKLVERTGNPKYYFVDTGLLGLFMPDAKPALLENMVALALIRRYGREKLYFYKDENSELDFYVPGQSLAIQVCYSLSDEQTKDRELSSLLKFNKFQPATKNLILTFNEESRLIEGGLEIQVMPVYKWLLS